MSTFISDKLLREGYLKTIVKELKFLEADKKEIIILGLTNMLKAQQLGASKKVMEHLRTAHKINIAQVEKQITNANKILIETTEVNRLKC